MFCSQFLNVPNLTLLAEHARARQASQPRSSQCHRKTKSATHTAGDLLFFTAVRFTCDDHAFVRHYKCVALTTLAFSKKEKKVRTFLH
jgi:hypothetical protein